MRMLAGASQAGVILDPRVLVKAGIDPRMLKKILAQAHPEEAGAAGLFEKMPWPLPEKMLLIQPKLDQQKREMEKQPERQTPSGKPQQGIEPAF